MVLGEAAHLGRAASCSGIREGSGGRMLELALKYEQLPRCRDGAGTAGRRPDDGGACSAKGKAYRGRRSW